MQNAKHDDRAEVLVHGISRDVWGASDYQLASA